MKSRREALLGLLGLALAIPLVRHLLGTEGARREPDSDPLLRLGELKLAEQGEDAIAWANDWASTHRPHWLGEPSAAGRSALRAPDPECAADSLEGVSGWLLPAPLVALAVLHASRSRGGNREGSFDRVAPPA